MPVACFPLGFLETNCYILHDATQAVVIDPGAGREHGLDRVLHFLDVHNLKTAAILCTHLHFDHVTGAAELAEAVGAPIYGGEADRPMLDDGVAAQWGFPPVPAFTFLPLKEEETAFGSFAVHVLSTPGHTPGSFSFHVPGENVLFAGDLLFRRSVGRTDLPGGDEATLLASIRSKVLTLPAQTTVYPGHGPETTTADEAAHNPFLRGTLS